MYEAPTRAVDTSALAETQSSLAEICHSLHNREAALRAELDGANLHRDTLAKALETVQIALKGLQPVDPTLPQPAPDPVYPRER